MINTQAVKTLIQIGININLHGEYRNEDLESLRPYEQINRLGPTAWKDVLSELDNTKLESLIRGLTIAERELRWTGGSVAAVIWLFRYLESRTESPRQEELADWILRNTRNGYLPFGKWNHGAKSYKEFQESVKRNQLIRENAKQDREKCEKEAKEQRKARASQRKRSSRDRNHKRKQMIEEFDQLSVKEQLKQIARDDVYPVNFYPARCAGMATTEMIMSLQLEEIQALVMKLKGKQKGPWGAFKKRLMCVKHAL